MKIPGSIRQLHESATEKYVHLQKDVDSLLQNQKRPSWHYESRLKSLESFAIKLESGRWRNLTKVDDLLASVIVVENNTTLPAAETLIKRFFDVKERRPPNSQQTTIRAEAFPFDDVRLYAGWPSNAPAPKPRYAGLIFEVQLRTFLQHAWNVATHDIVYKSMTKDWSKERLAAQVRANLENAEVVLCEIDTLARSKVLARIDKYTQRVNRITELLERHWETNSLPEDVKGLSSNVERLIRAMNVSIERLSKILETEKGIGLGTLPQNLSPFGIITSSLLRQERSAMHNLLCNARRGFTIWIPSELDLPENMDPSNFRDVVML